MSISINNNLHTQSYNHVKKCGKATSGFSMPDMKGASAMEESSPQVSGKTGVDDNGMIQDHLLSKVQMLPEHILNRTIEDVEKMIGVAPILVEWGEDGICRIKDGLSLENQIHAKKFLQEIEFWAKRGGKISIEK